jgi:glutamate-1-semialdehyde 2,1-aminomutase
MTIALHFSSALGGTFFLSQSHWLLGGIKLTTVTPLTAQRCWRIVISGENMLTAENAALQLWLDRELVQYAQKYPESRKLFESGQRHYLYGAPSHWMRRWAGGFPPYVKSASGAHVKSLEGTEFIDFCLGDTGGMCGHGDRQIADAVTTQMLAGATLMLPTAEADWVGAELTRRFRVPVWGFTTSASDANRAAIRIARMITGRKKVLVFSGCYHGSVEEAHVALDDDGNVILRNGIHPNGVDHAEVSRVIEFNDEAALSEALSAGDVACVLTEPFMTNYGMVEPCPGYLAALRRITKATGTLLIVDETHTFSSGPGGYAAPHGLNADFVVLGKAVGGGIPVGLYGMSEEVATAFHALVPKVQPTKVRQSAHLGFGGTLAGSALQVSAVKVVLERVLTEENFAHMLSLAASLAARIRDSISRHRLPWCVVQAGARIETMFCPEPPTNAREVRSGRNDLLEALWHVYSLNHGILITPFHTMLLMCPATSGSDADRYGVVFEAFCEQVAGIYPNGDAAK